MPSNDNFSDLAARDRAASVINTTYHVQHDAVVVKETMDAEPLFEYTKGVAHDNPRSVRAKKPGRMVGSIPFILGAQWAKEWGVKLYSKEWLEKAQKRIETDPNFKKLRIEYDGPVPLLGASK